jgi:hypothetical protein
LWSASSRDTARFSIVALGDRRIEICWRFQSWEFSLLVQEAFYEQIFINAGGLLACLAQITTVRASDRAIRIDDYPLLRLAPGKARTSGHYPRSAKYAQADRQSGRAQSGQVHRETFEIGE